MASNTSVHENSHKIIVAQVWNGFNTTELAAPLD